MVTSNLLIVGDSFVASCLPSHNDTHFKARRTNLKEPSWAWWNRLANELNADCNNLGIGGASNFNIYHQLKEGLKTDPERILVVLTSPNRIESYHKGDPNQEISYKSFVTQDFHSWAAHDRLSQKEFNVDFFDRYFNPAVNISKDQIIVDAIVDMCKDYKSVILPNLFNDWMKPDLPKVLYSVIPRDYCDVVTGQLDEPEAGHIHKSFHEKFCNDNMHQILDALS